MKKIRNGVFLPPDTYCAQRIISAWLCLAKCSTRDTVTPGTFSDIPHTCSTELTTYRACPLLTEVAYMSSQSAVKLLHTRNGDSHCSPVSSEGATQDT